jgi:polysaccharide biosynthesis protein PslH
MQSLKILMAMIEAPVPFGNAASRWFYVLLRELVARGHRVTAFAACSKEKEIDEAKKLFPAPQYDLRCYPFPHRSGLWSKFQTWRRPYSYMFSNEFKNDWNREIASGCDVIHLEQMWCAWLALQHRDTALLNVHHLTWIDLEHIQADPNQRNRSFQLMLDTERRLVRKMQHIRSCSPRLVPEMLSVNPKAKITTVPVGIDSSLYDSIPNEKRSSEPVISVIGTMNWHPSHSAAVRLLTRLWPKIHERVPNARVQIIGWSARTALKEFLDLPNVTIEENVPDTRPYFERTAVMCYAPGRGSGMKIKILEAFGYGVPVVTTSEGVEGIPAVDGVHAGVCEDDEGLIERTVQLLHDIERQNRQRQAARRLLEEHCGPKPTVDAIEAIYQRMLSPEGVA